MELDNQPTLLIVQYNISEESSSIVACAQHICKAVSTSLTSSQHFILFLLQLSTAEDMQRTLTGFQSHWVCAHIDDIRKPDKHLPSLIEYCDSPVSCLFEQKSLFILKFQG